MIQSKPREFWVWPEHLQCRDVGTYLTMTPKGSVEPIHVIEKSAYDKLAAALKVACEIIDMQTEALSFCCYKPSGEFVGSEHPAYKAIDAAEKMMGDV